MTESVVANDVIVCRHADLRYDHQPRPQMEVCT